MSDQLSNMKGLVKCPPDEYPPERLPLFSYTSTQRLSKPSLTTFKYSSPIGSSAFNIQDFASSYGISNLTSLTSGV